MTPKPRGVLRAARLRARGGATSIVIDVDGCMTDGSIYLSGDGVKLFKRFGPDDHDAILEAEDLIVTLVTADKRGLDIVEQRADQLNLNLMCVSTEERRTLLGDRTVYIGDGYYDGWLMKDAGFGIAPSDAYPTTKRRADAVCSRPGGRRAVAQAIEFTLRWLR